jgi:hypothetical protein
VSSYIPNGAPPEAYDESADRRHRAIMAMACDALRASLWREHPQIVRMLVDKNGDGSGTDSGG